jgi:hypothetical protein
MTKSMRIQLKVRSNYRMVYGKFFFSLHSCVMFASNCKFILVIKNEYSSAFKRPVLLV